jgi:tRNA pseudouridine38-40 synthase
LITIFEALRTKRQPARIYDFGQSFFRNMVRSIVGTLVNVGLNKITLDDFNTIINKNRDKAGFSVPHGLYLTEINKYDYNSP